MYQFKRLFVSFLYISCAVDLEVTRPRSLFRCERFGGITYLLRRSSILSGCEVAAGTLLPPGTARVAHRAPPAKRLEDIPPKTWDMVVAEIPCQKVLDDKEKKKRGNLRRKSPTRLLLLTFNPRRPLTRLLGEKALPLEALANEEHVSLPLSVGRMDTLRDQTNEPVTPLGLFMLARWLLMRGIRVMLMLPMPSRVIVTMRVAYPDCRFILALLCPFGCRRLDTLEETAPENIMSDTKALSGTFPLPPNGDSRIQVAWTTHHADLAYAHESCKDVKVRYKECKKELVAIQSALEELEEEIKQADQLSSSQADRLKQLEEALKQSEADAHQLRVEKERYAVEACRGDMPNLYYIFARYEHKEDQHAVPLEPQSEVRCLLAVGQIDITNSKSTGWLTHPEHPR
ncbi:hypothetical protein Tco_1244768 [Tanacetum coccineum]